MAQKIWIEAEDVIRILTGDIKKQAEEMLWKVDAGELVFCLTPLVVAKCCWNLTANTVAGHKEIADALLKFINVPGVETEEKAIVVQALKDFGENDVEFTDAFIAAYGQANPSAGVDTWYKYLERLGVRFDEQEEREV